MDTKKLLIGAGIIGGVYYLLSNSSATQNLGAGGGSGGQTLILETKKSAQTGEGQGSGAVSPEFNVTFEPTDLSSLSSSTSSGTTNPVAESKKEKVFNAQGAVASFDSNGVGTIYSPSGQPVASTTKELFNPIGSSAQDEPKVTTSKKSSPIILSAFQGISAITRLFRK